MTGLHLKVEPRETTHEFFVEASAYFSASAMVAEEVGIDGRQSITQELSRRVYDQMLEELKYVLAHRDTQKDMEIKHLSGLLDASTQRERTLSAALNRITGVN